MSTPYVGLNQVLQGFKSFANEDSNPWQSYDENVSEELAMSSEDYLSEVKRRLIHILVSEFGVQTIQVGAFSMALSTSVPTRHLMKATHYLIEQYRQESSKENYLPVLEACLRLLLQGGYSTKS